MVDGEQPTDLAGPQGGDPQVDPPDKPVGATPSTPSEPLIRARPIASGAFRPVPITLPLVAGPPGSPVLSVRAVLLLLLVIGIAYFGMSGGVYAVSNDEANGPAVELGITVGQWVLFLLLPLLVALVAGANLRMTFSWSRPRLDLVILTLTTTLCLIGTVQYAGDFGMMYLSEPYDRLFEGILPKTSERLEEVSKLFKAQSTGGVALVLLLAAITPAICEEHFFRGMVQSSLIREISPGLAVVVVAMIFAAFHFEPVVFGALLLIGLIMGLFTARSRCLLYACLIHGANNAVSVLLQNAMGEHIEPIQGGAGSFDSMPIYLLGGVVGVLAFVARTPRLYPGGTLEAWTTNDPPVFQPGRWHRASVWLAGRWRMAALIAAICSLSGLALDIRDVREIAAAAKARPADDAEQDANHPRKDIEDYRKDVPSPWQGEESDSPSILNVGGNGKTWRGEAPGRRVLKARVHPLSRGFRTP